MALKERPGNTIASRTTGVPAVLDRPCARRLHGGAGRDEKMLSAELKDGTEEKTTIRQRRDPEPNTPAGSRNRRKLTPPSMRWF